MKLLTFKTKYQRYNSNTPVDKVKQFHLHKMLAKVSK